MKCTRCGHHRDRHWNSGACTAFGEDAPCDCPAFVAQQERRQHSHGELHHTHYVEASGDAREAPQHEHR